ncbi:MAG: oxidoreductase [Sandaracinaceae bacterium]
MSKKGFTEVDVPSQAGRIALVTGANTGIGFHVARVLAERGARVLLGCRSVDKANAAAARIRLTAPDADVGIVSLDLADLSSVKRAAAQVGGEPKLDRLINNAGLMAPPYQQTRDGFESQFGVNHLGPFALTGLLLPMLTKTPGARIVNTSSTAHRAARVNLQALNAENGYSAMTQYALSKLANLLHTYELDRRFRRAGYDTLSVAAHPGGSDTELPRYFPSAGRLIPLVRPFLNSAEAGAWPTLLAATGDDVRSGEYFGPAGFAELAGPARRVRSTRKSHDPQLAQKVWDASVRLTGVDPKFAPA